MKLSCLKDVTKDSEFYSSWNDECNDKKKKKNRWIFLNQVFLLIINKFEESFFLFMTLKNFDFAISKYMVWKIIVIVKFLSYWNTWQIVEFQKLFEYLLNNILIFYESRRMKIPDIVYTYIWKNSRNSVALFHIEKNYSNIYSHTEYFWKYHNFLYVSKIVQQIMVSPKFFSKKKINK